MFTLEELENQRDEIQSKIDLLMMNTQRKIDNYEKRMQKIEDKIAKMIQQKQYFVMKGEYIMIAKFIITPVSNVTSYTQVAIDPLKVSIVNADWRSYMKIYDMDLQQERLCKVSEISVYNHRIMDGNIQNHIINMLSLSEYEHEQTTKG